MEAWEIIYILVLFEGLLVGWLVNPYLAVAFIWTFIILLEVLSTRKKKSRHDSHG